MSCSEKLRIAEDRLKAARIKDKYQQTIIDYLRKKVAELEAQKKPNMN
jgi:hypothetical protein